MHSCRRPSGRCRGRGSLSGRRAAALRALLVSRDRSSLAKSSDAGKDVLGGLGPDEGLGCGVAGGQVEADGVLQLPRGFVTGAAELPLGQGRKPTVDLIDPGAGGGGVMGVK